MPKQHQPLYLSPEAAATLKKLATELDCTNQRGQHSIGALCEWLAQTADSAFHETVADLEVSAGCAAGGDWRELT